MSRNHRLNQDGKYVFSERATRHDFLTQIVRFSLGIVMSVMCEPNSRAFCKAYFGPASVSYVQRPAKSNSGLMNLQNVFLYKFCVQHFATDILNTAFLNTNALKVQQYD